MTTLAIQRRIPIRPSTLLVALGGPAAIGAVLGMPAGAAAMARGAVALPAVILGTAAVMLPALYIVSSLVGSAPPARSTPGLLGRALRANGILLLGLAGPAAFLAATMGSRWTALLLGALVTALGSLAGIRSLFAGMSEEATLGVRGRLACLSWAVVSLTIGARLFLETMGGAA